MNVVVVTTRHGAQDDRIYHKEALSLAKIMDVVMVAPDDGETLEWGCGISFRPIPRRRSLLGRMLSIAEAVRVIRKEKPDFCHLHDLDLVLAIPLIRLVSRATIVYDCHEAFPEQVLINKRLPKRIRPLLSRLVDTVEKVLSRLAAHVVTADKSTTESFRRRSIAATTLFNFPLTEMFENASFPDHVVEDQCRDRKIILYHGSMSLDRGLLHMIDALQIIKKKEAVILLRLLGRVKPDQTEMMLERARETGVEGNLELTGWVPFESIPALIRSSDIGLVPLEPNEKYMRNIPIKMFEYMACSIPTIAADLPPIRQFLSQVNAGVLYDSTRPEELARCVLELLGDPERCRQMGEEGARAVRDRWNWGEMEKRLFGIYESMGAEFQGREG